MGIRVDVQMEVGLGPGYPLEEEVVSLPSAGCSARRCQTTLFSVRFSCSLSLSDCLNALDLKVVLSDRDDGYHQSVNSSYVSHNHYVTLSHTRVTSHRNN